MLMRYLNICHEEVWTDFSRTYVPVGYTPSSLAVKLNGLLDAAPVLKDHLRQHLPCAWWDHFLSDVHVEHEACEYRKCIDGRGKNRE